MYQIPCKKCGIEYIEEIGILINNRLDEHKNDVDNIKNEKYTRI